MLIQEDVCSEVKESQFETLNKIKQRLISIKTQKTSSDELIALFDSLSQIHDNIQGTDNLRVVVNDTLAIWFLKASKFCIATKGCIKISKPKIIELFNYAIDFLQVSKGPLMNSLKALIDRMIQFVGYMNDSDVIFCSFVDSAMLIDENSKQMYHLIETLSKKHKSDYISKTFPHFVGFCIQNMSATSLAPSIGKCLVSLYKTSQWCDEEWVGLITGGLKDPDLTENLQKYLLPSFAAAFPSLFSNITRYILSEVSGDREADLVVSILSIGRTLSSPNILNDDLVPIEFLTNLLYHENSKFRLNALALLLNTTKTSNPIPKAAYEIVIKGGLIQIFMDDSDNDVRAEFVSILNRFLIWVKGSLHSSHRALEKLKNANIEVSHENNLRQNLENGRTFISFLVETIPVYMLPGSTYPEMIVSYNLLQSLIDLDFDSQDREKLSTSDKNFVQYPFDLTIYTPKLISFLITNIFNNYDDIRNMSSCLLLKCPKNSLVEFISVNETELIEMAINISFEIKGRKSDGASKFFEFLTIYYIRFLSNDKKVMELVDLLVSTLETGLKNLDLISLSKELQVHEYFASITQILAILLGEKSFKNYISELTPSLKRSIFVLWDKIGPVLSGPFGEAYDSLNERAILSFSWRALQSSNLLLVLLQRTYKLDKMISVDDFLSFTVLIILQLNHISHRGAFMSVYPSFISSCEICLSEFELKEHPRKWLQSNLDLVTSKSQLISRRSGSLPYLITAILVAEQKSCSSKDLAKYATQRLFNIAEIPLKYDEKFDIPQVHAFNCLQQIFDDTALNSVCQDILASSLNLAITNFSSPSWSIRNCSVMLYTSLRQKVFGKTKMDSKSSKINSKVFFARYQGIQVILLESLKTCMNNEQLTSALFPALDILANLHFSDDISVSEFYPLLEKLLGSPSWNIRQMAAHALVETLENDIILETMSRMMSNFSEISFNKIHGNLLFILQAIKRYQSSDKSEVSSLFEQLLTNFFINLFGKGKNFHWVIYGAYVNIVMAFYDGSNKELSRTHLNALGNFFLKNVTFNYHLLDGARDVCMSSLLHLLVQEYTKKKNSEDVVDLICLGVTCESSSIRMKSLQLGQSNAQILGECPYFIDLLWSSIEREQFGLLKSKGIDLLCEISSYKIGKKEVSLTSTLRELVTEGLTVDARCSSLVYLALIGSILPKEDLTLVVLLGKELYDDKNIFQKRLAAISAMASVINKSHYEHHLDLDALCVLFYGLYDNEEEIRLQSSRSLSKLFGQKYPMSPQAVIKSFETEIQSLLDPTCFQILATTIFLSQGTNKLVKVLPSSVDNDFLDWEDINLYKNRFRLAQVISSMISKAHLSNSNILKLTQRALEELEQIIDIMHRKQSDGIIGWSIDKFYFNVVLIALIDIHAVLHVSSNHEIQAKLELFRGLCKKYKLNSIFDVFFLQLMP
ncbi:uncharacterized protein PRCAT00004722001 [Priceomyces carsonii]|uniref:uncharacterized protein n=1 Tax=Priceomyces carsonii TaxID=28549 RepID=UPI002ED8E5F5|nr:unnamed protein product [Priceomyces carsonii]